MKKVLMISYVFPPMAAVGGYRTIKFCKFLPEYGWLPSVLTVKSGHNVAYDPSLLDNIDPMIKVFRSGNWEPLTWWDERTAPPEKATQLTTAQSQRSTQPEHLSLLGRCKQTLKQMLSQPDRNNFWIPFGVIAALEAANQEKVDVIFSTSPPASSHIIGRTVAFLTGKPLVVDFRDLWTQNEGYHLRQLPSWMARCDRWQERRVLKRSRAVITATDTFGQLIRENNSHLPPESVYTITNGIDRDDFSHIELPSTKNKKFTLLHLGSLYGNRHPGFFFDALTKWAEQRPEILGQVLVEFVGNTPGFERLAASPPLSDLVRFQSHIPHDRVLQKLWEADLLLLILGFDKASRGVLPAKLFEYLCTGRPTLAFVPPGEASRAIEDHEGGVAITTPDMEKTINTLDRYYDAWVASSAVRVSRIDPPRKFDRRAQAGQLAEILNNVVR